MGGDIEEIYKYINHYAVVTKASSKIILVQVYIIFALPDYSSEVIEICCLKKNRNAPTDLLSIPQSGGKKRQNV